MKKVVSMLLVLSLVLGMGTVAFAETSKDITGELGGTVKVSTSNEYARLKELAKEGEFSLVKQGYTKSEIIEIRDYKENYIKHIEKLGDLEDQALNNLGYNEEQIKMIRNFKGSEAELYGLSATLSLNIRIASFEFKENDPKSSRYNKGTFEFGWAWDGIPMSTSTDLVGASWNSWAITSRDSTIRYFDMTTGAYKKATAGTKKDPTGAGTIGGAGYKFPLRISSENLFARNGQVTFKLKSDVHDLKDFYYYVAYGHTVLTVSPSFSVSGSGPNVGLSFGSGVNELSPKQGHKVPKIIS